MEYAINWTWPYQLPGINAIVAAFFMGHGYDLAEEVGLRQVFVRGDHNFSGKMSFFASGGTFQKMPIKVYVSYLLAPGSTQVFIRYDMASWLTAGWPPTSWATDSAAQEISGFGRYIDAWRERGMLSGGYSDSQK